MSAYYFRVIEDDKPNGYIGFVYAEIGAVEVMVKEDLV